MCNVGIDGKGKVHNREETEGDGKGKTKRLPLIIMPSLLYP